jgi:N-acetylneuraminic acid mutarotase
MDRLQSHLNASTSGRPPQSLFFQYPVCGGTVPSARWAHASAAVGSLMYFYGGVGNTILDEMVMLDTDVLVWRGLNPSACKPKDRPEKLHAAAMCATGKTLWLFGGQQGRKYLRGLHSLNTETLVWKLHTPSGPTPAGRAGHTLTAVPDSSIYLFGGQGKKLYNDMLLLRASTQEWIELKPRGQLPPARHGHSTCWDGSDRLVLFGGTTAGTTDNCLFLYSISRNEWVKPEPSGTLPTPRTNHSAVMLPGNKFMLLFGGCNAQVGTEGQA